MQTSGVVDVIATGSPAFAPVKAATTENVPRGALTGCGEGSVVNAADCAFIVNCCGSTSVVPA